jgi:hypothetical protein
MNSSYLAKFSPSYKNPLYKISTLPSKYNDASLTHYCTGT